MAEEKTAETRTVEIKVVLPITFRWTCPDCRLEFLVIIHNDQLSDQKVQCKECGQIFLTAT